MDSHTNEGRFWFVTLAAGHTEWDYAIVSEAIISPHTATLKALEAFCQSEQGGVNATFKVLATPLVPNKE